MKTAQRVFLAALVPILSFAGVANGQGAGKGGPEATNPGIKAFLDEVKKGKVFILPDQDKDQHGNPVATRGGSKTDPATGLPCEIWLKNPRIEFVLIPAGEFDMGSPDSEAGRWPNEGPVHRVKLAKPFYLAKYETTQGQWKAIKGDNPSCFANAGAGAPVEQVSWDDCQEFIKKLNSASPIPNSAFRLPTEAEWEYACRAGTKTALYTGLLTIAGKKTETDDQTTSTEVNEIAWYGGNSGVTYEGGEDSSNCQGGKHFEFATAGTHPVGKKKPNAWGLYDMIGNVCEWCEDHWHDTYEGAPSDGSAWLGGAPKQWAPDMPPQPPDRVGRGTCWRLPASWSRCAFHHYYPPDCGDNILGFRIACSVEKK